MSDVWDDEYEDDYYDEEEDDYNDDSPDAWYECPLCGAEVYDEADLCPACDQYMTPQLVTRSDKRPMWYIILGMAGILAVLLTLSGLIRFLF